MAYTAFDLTKPAGSQTGPAFAASANSNDTALLDMIGGLLMPGFALTTRTGTDEPTVLLFTSGTRYFRVTLTWSSHRIATVKFELSTNSGGAYDQIGSTATLSYDGSGNATGVTNLGGMWLTFCEVWGKYNTLKAAYDAHAAATGTSVHSLGSISTQSAASVVITGGAIDGATVGTTTPALATFKQARSPHVAPSFGATTTIDWSLGESFAFTATGSGAATLAFSNLPATGIFASVTIEITNGGLRSPWTFPSGTKYVGGAAPSLSSSGRDRLVFMTRDGGSTYDCLFNKGMA